MAADRLIEILKMLFDPRGYLFYLVLALTLILVFFLYRRSGRRERGRVNYNAYRLRNSLLTKNELAFYLVLERIIPDEAVVLPKVRLADIFSTAGGRRNQGDFNRISARHVDFLVCEQESFRPLFAIELDDRSHTMPDRVQRDAFVNSLFDAAGLPLVRVPARGRYTTTEVRERLTGVLSES